MSKINGIKLKKIRGGLFNMLPKWELDMGEWNLELCEQFVAALKDPNADLKCDKVSFIYQKSNPPTLTLQVKRGYRWGVTGWPWPPEGAARAAMVHDALYGAMGCGVIDKAKSREAADGLFYRHLKDAGVSKSLAALANIFVRLFGGLYGRKCEKC